LKYLKYSIIIGIIGFTGVSGSFKLANVDVWRIIKTGEYVVKNKKIPQQDIYSYTNKGNRWYCNMWLSGVIFYEIYKRTGIKGLVGFKIIIITGMIGLMLLMFRHKNKSLMLWVAVIVWLTFTIRGRFTVRKELFSFLFLSVYLFILTKYETCSRKYIFILPLFSLLWSNLHIGSAFGVTLLWGYLIGLLIDRERREKTFLFFVVCVLTSICSLVNPSGFHVFLLPLKTIKDPFLMSQVDEFLPPKIILHKLYFVGLGITFVGMGVKWREIKFKDLLPVFLGVIVSLKARRNIPLFVIVAGPILVKYWGKILEKKIQKIENIKPIYPILLGGIVFLTCWVAKNYASLNILGFGVDKNWKAYPYLGCNFIEKNKIKGRVFNWDGFGNYFIFKFWPKREVFVDGRFNEVYQTEFLQNTYRYLQLAKKGWEKIFEKYDIQYVFTQVDDGSPLIHQLIKHPDWHLVYWDDVCKIYIKKGKNQQIIEKFFYSIVEPLHFEPHFLPSSLLSQAVTELQYNLELNPTCFRAHAMLGMVYLKLGKTELAIKEFKECIKLNPRSIYVYYNLGLAYEVKGDFLEAIKYYKKEVKKNPYFLPTYEGLSFCYKKLGDEVLAKKWLYLGEKIKKKLQNKTPYF